MRKKQYRFWIGAFIFTIIASTIFLSASGAAPLVEELKIGDYIILGQYNGQPVVWRYAADDEHGRLMVSDKILCFKPFGDDNFWETSFPRKWLNSTAAEGEVDWSEGYSDAVAEDIDRNQEGLLHEKGFLHDSNFSETEKSVMQTVTQWTMLPEEHLDLSANGITEQYFPYKAYYPGPPHDGGYIEGYEFSELAEAYHGAAYQITDTVFLLDEMQIYHMWENFGNLRALYVEGYPNCPENPYTKYYPYTLRTPEILSKWDCTAIIYPGTGYEAVCFA